MRCETTEERLSAYLDGELSSREQIEIDEHLRACSSCAREYEQLKTMARAYRGLCHELPSDMWAGVHERIGQESTDGRYESIREWFSPAWRPLAMTALLVFGLFTYFWFTQPADELPLDYYLEAYSDFASTASLTPDSLVAYVLPEDQGDSDVFWDTETSLMIEHYLEDN